MQKMILALAATVTVCGTTADAKSVATEGPAPVKIAKANQKVSKVSVAGPIAGTDASAGANELAMKMGTDSATILEMPATQSRRRLLFSFGLFGTGVRLGWKKPEVINQAGVLNGEEPRRKGVGSPIMTFSVGRKEFGLGATNAPQSARQSTSSATGTN